MLFIAMKSAVSYSRVPEQLAVRSAPRTRVQDPFPGPGRPVDARVEEPVLVDPAAVALAAVDRHDQRPYAQTVTDRSDGVVGECRATTTAALPCGRTARSTRGGAEGTRTPDPHTASVVRYQLRHSPVSCRSRRPIV